LLNDDDIPLAEKAASMPSENFSPELLDLTRLDLTRVHFEETGEGVQGFNSRSRSP
jgi:hypothetical protein